jgi:hypothetical protein
LAALALLALAQPVSAGLITFDPDGAAPANSAQTIGGLDWAVGNSLQKGSNPPVIGATVQHYYQATLAGVINPAGLTVAPTGLNSTFEITAAMSVTEIVTSVSSVSGLSTVTYAVAGVQSANSFFEIWFDSTPDANNLAGTGFNDGSRIYLGGADPAKANLGSYTGSQAIQLFDQFGPDNYAGKPSQVGTGAFTDENTVASRDASFFITDIASMSFNTSMVTPFKEVDPSLLFAGQANGVPPAIVPTIGSPNGFLSTAPDIQFQSDASVTFTAVPEPTGLLAAAGFALAATATRRRRRAG